MQSCLLPNFAMIALSKFSEPAVFVASVLIHTSGIVLLIQYLFMRHTCQQCHQSFRRPAFPEISHPQNFRVLSRRSLSDSSVNSDEFTRKRRRPYTTYGSGGEYINYLRRGSLDTQFDLSFRSTGRVTQTASGRRIPVRSPSNGSTPRPGSSTELRRSGSTHNAERRSISGVGSPRSTTPVAFESAMDKSPEKPLPLRRTKSGSIFRENLEDSTWNEKEASRPGSSGNRSTSSKGKGTPSRELTIQAQGPSVGLKPVLLPPLRDPLRSASASPLAQTSRRYRHPHCRCLIGPLQSHLNQNQY